MTCDTDQWQERQPAPWHVGQFRFLRGCMMVFLLIRALIMRHHLQSVAFSRLWLAGFSTKMRGHVAFSMRISIETPLTMPDDLVEPHLSLARIIAFEYANMPEASMDEVVAEADGTLAAAGRSFDTDKGQFTAYASPVIRNAFNRFFARQLHDVKAHDFSLDKEPTTSNSTSTRSPKNHADLGAGVALAARGVESRRILEGVSPNCHRALG